MIPVTWVIFAVTDLRELGIYLERMFPFNGGGIAVNPRDFIKYLGMYWYYLLAGVVWCVPAVSGFFKKHRRHPAVVLLSAAIFWLSVYCVVSMENNPFAYLKF